LERQLSSYWKNFTASTQCTFYSILQCKNLFKSRRGPKARGGTSNIKTRKNFDLIRHYFFHSMPKKPFPFNQALFLKVGTSFSSKIDGFPNSLLRSEKTFSFNQALFLKVGTCISSKIDGFQNSLNTL